MARGPNLEPAQPEQHAPWPQPQDGPAHQARLLARQRRDVPAAAHRVPQRDCGGLLRFVRSGRSQRAPGAPGRLHLAALHADVRRAGMADPPLQSGSRPPAAHTGVQARHPRGPAGHGPSSPRRRSARVPPAALFAPRDELGAAIDAVLEEGSSAAAHIFNLGHGIHRTTDPDRVAFLVDRVHETSARLHASRTTGHGS